MHYALLIYERPANYEGLSDDERRAMTAEYMAVTEESIGSAHLQPTSMATTVRVADGAPLVTDGPFADTKDVFGGYYVIEADDLDAAIAIAARVPAARFGGGGGTRPAGGGPWRSAPCGGSCAESARGVGPRPRDPRRRPRRLRSRRGRRAGGVRRGRGGLAARRRAG